MATIRKRGTSWQAQVRKDGFPPLSKSFRFKADAVVWAREQERQIQLGELPITARDAQGITLGDLLRRYRESVTPTKRGAVPETSRLLRIEKHDLAKTALAALTPAAMAAYRDVRLSEVKPATVRRELTVIRHCLELARREWGVPLKGNAVKQIAVPACSPPRSVRLSDEGFRALAAGLRVSRAPYLSALVALAVETGMRRSELLALSWQQVDFASQVAHLPPGKNGHPRAVPLTSRALKVIGSLERLDTRVFPVTANAVRLAWERLRKRAGLHSFRFHDLRHEAVSRFFELGLNVPEVALISGHRDARMLFRYTHLKADQLASKFTAILGDTPLVPSLQAEAALSGHGVGSRLASSDSFGMALPVQSQMNNQLSLFSGASQGDCVQSGSPFEYDLKPGSVGRRALGRELPFSYIEHDLHLPYVGDIGSAYDQAWLKAAQLPQPVLPLGPIRVVDLFAGCGGLSLGAREAAHALGYSFVSVLAAEFEPDALAVYEANFSPYQSLSDAIEAHIDGGFGSEASDSELSIARACGHVDLLLAGPPCQGHSDLNNHTRRNDPKNSLVLRVARFAELVRPEMVVIENVQGILHDKNKAAQLAITQLSALGYEVTHGLIDASAIGVPQRRRRCFIVASKSGAPPLQSIVQCHTTPIRSFDWACADLRGTRKCGLFDTSAKVSAENKRRMQFLIDMDLHELPDAERPDCHRLKDHGYSSVYGRLYADEPAPTVTTGFGSPGQGRFTHPYEPRTISPHEAARLQFFPDSFQFPIVGRKKLQKLIGNAVPSKLSFAVCFELLRAREAYAMKGVSR